ncbi:MAG: phytanoyl-CoA dioxygenase family protein [Planctomycetes bacterium]|nr:phytanoyl-CoA dioxygenase family protein [Planctomycetota bacterium]
MKLTPEQIDFFWQNGYLSCEKFLTDDEIVMYRAEYDRVFDEANQSGRLRNLSEPKADAAATATQAPPKRMLQIVQMCERSLLFHKFIYEPRLLDIVQDLIGPNLMLFHDQALYKPAHHGGPVPWHQDNSYWRCSPANLVSCWIALDDAVRDNGAMQFIPGSHLTPVWHGPSDSDALIRANVDDSRAVCVELPAGACTFHHCQTLHFTQPNTTDRDRRAFVIHYMPPGTRSANTKGEVIHADFAHPVLRLSF